MRQLYKKFPESLLRFICVGSIGFLVDATVLSILIFEFGLGRYIARVLSFGVAVPCTWILNRTWTFREKATPNRTREYTFYLLIQSCGVLLNFTIYSLCIFFSSLMMSFPVIALAIGSGTSMLFNYLALQRFAFTGDRMRSKNP